MAQLDPVRNLRSLPTRRNRMRLRVIRNVENATSRGGKGVGSTEGMGICQLMRPTVAAFLAQDPAPNSCIFDAIIASKRKSSNVRRARFTAAEVVHLTLSFYKRNDIEGLFLSSGIIG